MQESALLFPWQECHLKRSSDPDALAHRLHSSFQSNCYYGTDRRPAAAGGFTINHYAEPVWYAVEGLLHKNKVGSLI